MPYCKKCGTAAVMEETPAPKLAFWGERFVAWLIRLEVTPTKKGQPQP
jgi:hypothetical protein